MADQYPFRLRVLRALTARLEEISSTGGLYEFDMAGKVFRGRHWYGDDDPLPLISILEAPLPLDQIGSANDNAASAGQWELLIQGFLDDDDKNPTDPAHFLLALTRQKLVEIKGQKKDQRVPGNPYNILGMDGRVTALTIGPGVVRPPDDLSAKAYFWLSVTLSLVEKLDTPFE